MRTEHAQQDASHIRRPRLESSADDNLAFRPVENVDASDFYSHQPSWTPSSFSSPSSRLETTIASSPRTATTQENVLSSPCRTSSEISSLLQRTSITETSIHNTSPPSQSPRSSRPTGLRSRIIDFQRAELTKAEKESRWDDAVQYVRELLKNFQPGSQDYENYSINLAVALYQLQRYDEARIAWKDINYSVLADEERNVYFFGYAKTLIVYDSDLGDAKDAMLSIVLEDALETVPDEWLLLLIEICEKRNETLEAKFYTSFLKDSQKPTNAADQSQSPRNLYLDIQNPDITFRQPFDKELLHTIYLINKTDQPVVFKVLTTAPTTYCARPNRGIARAGQKINVGIYLQPTKLELPALLVNRDRFLVKSCPIDESDAYEPVTQVWEKYNNEYKDKIQERKIKVTFLA